MGVKKRHVPRREKISCSERVGGSFLDRNIDPLDPDSNLLSDPDSDLKPDSEFYCSFFGLGYSPTPKL